jgi:hypothetical protein
MTLTIGTRSLSPGNGWPGFKSQYSIPDVEKSITPDTNSEVVCSSEDVNTMRKCSLPPNILLECG